MDRHGDDVCLGTIPGPTRAEFGRLRHSRPDAAGRPSVRNRLGPSGEGFVRLPGGGSGRIGEAVARSGRLDVCSLVACLSRTASPIFDLTRDPSAEMIDAMASAPLERWYSIDPTVNSLKKIGSGDGHGGRHLRADRDDGEPTVHHGDQPGEEVLAHEEVTIAASRQSPQALSVSVSHCERGRWPDRARDVERRWPCQVLPRIGLMVWENTHNLSEAGSYPRRHGRPPRWLGRTVSGSMSMGPGSSMLLPPPVCPPIDLQQCRTPSGFCFEGAGGAGRFDRLRPG
jgi:hypothetical protein